MTPATQRWTDRLRRTDSGCLVYTQALDAGGYARVRLDGRVMRLHRAVYLLTHGSIPDDADVDHECHNLDESCSGGVTCPHRACCEPTHLVARSRAGNLARGRYGPGRRRKTHCTNGHELPDEATFVSSGIRRCRACHRDAGRRSDAKRAGQPRRH
jgi:hypothetical protein